MSREIKKQIPIYMFPSKHGEMVKVAVKLNKPITYVYDQALTEFLNKAKA